MEHLVNKRLEINENGFTVIEDMYDSAEVNNIIAVIEGVEANNPAFRKTGGLFAIRRFLKEVPGAAPHIFTSKLKNAIGAIFGNGYFVVKSIYFDKPPISNWFVAYHQDITISVAGKHDAEGFVNWTVKQAQYAVQPPVEILQDNFTVRIHLDDTDEHNGALKVIPGSHKDGIVVQKEGGFSAETEITCRVKKGGMMVMRPLLLHASGRTVNNKRRRVVHIECSKTELPPPLDWGEKELVEW